MAPIVLILANAKATAGILIRVSIDRNSLGRKHLSMALTAVIYRAVKILLGGKMLLMPQGPTMIPSISQIVRCKPLFLIGGRIVGRGSNNFFWKSMPKKTRER